MSPDDPRHGTHAGHNAHYRGADADNDPCEPCKLAHAEYKRQLWRRRYARRVDRLYVPALGARRRVRALQRIGYSLAHIGRELGYECDAATARKYVHRFMTQERVHIDTHEKVCEVYDRLCMTPGPSRPTMLTAIRKGWAPPLAWDEGEIDNPEAEPQGLKDKRCTA